jgi:DNA polymerase-3 subunit gamma/tau
MSLYRKYRPKTFADVAGQDHIVETLNQALIQDKFAHAYLFAGIRGTGKTSVARLLALSLLTQSIVDPVLKGQITKAAEEGNLVDLTEIDAASNNGVDNIRDLIEKIQFTPVVAGAKVYIIDEVHMLSKGAFNALLKTLEEPPSYAYFILATTELHKIPATIQSRCQRFLFKQIREEDVVQRLRFIADAEQMSIEDAALKAIAHHGGGSMRDSISLLDQLRSLTKNILLQDVQERVGESGHEYVEHILNAIENGDRDVIIASVRKMEESAVPFENVTRLLLEEVRNRLHAAVSNRTDTTRFLALLDALMDTIRDLRIAPVPGLVLESALLSLASPLESSVAQPAKTSPASPPPVEKIPTTLPPPSTPLPPALHSEKKIDVSAEMKTKTEPSADWTLATIKNQWHTIVDASEPPYVRMSLKNAQLHSLEGNTLILRFGSSFHRDKVASPEGSHAVEEVITRTFKRPVRIKCMLDSDLHGTALPKEDNVNMAEAALDIF